MKRLNRNGLIAVTALVAILFSVVLVLIYQQWKTSELAKQSQPIERPIDTQTPQQPPVVEEPIETQITIGMVGDILLHKPMYHYPEFNFAFQGVKEQMEGIDFLLANQESMPGGAELGLSTYPVFNSPPSIIRDLKNNGVDFITIANNHTLDKGEAQVQKSIEHLKEYDMPYTGAYVSEEDQATIRIVDVQGVQIGVLAYTYGTNVYGKGHPDGKTYLVNVIEEERIVNDIHQAKEEGAEVVVLALHWGDEYKNEETEEQRRLATRFFEEGADMIFGHHPHVLQPYESIEGKPVFYSIGNFYSGMPWPGTNIGGIARVTITKKEVGGDVSISIDASHFFPTAVLKDATAGPYYPAFRIVPLEQVGQHMGYTPEWIEQLLGVPSW